MCPLKAIPVLWKPTHGQDDFKRASPVSQLRNSQQCAQNILFNRCCYTPLLEHAEANNDAANHEHLVVLVVLVVLVGLVGLLRPLNVDMYIELQLLMNCLASRVIGAEDTQGECRIRGFACSPTFSSAFLPSLSSFSLNSQRVPSSNLGPFSLHPTLGFSDIKEGSGAYVEDTKGTWV